MLLVYQLAFFTTREVEPFEELTWVGGVPAIVVIHPPLHFTAHSK